MLSILDTAGTPVKRIRHERTRVAERGGPLADMFELGGRPYHILADVQIVGGRAMHNHTGRYLTEGGDTSGINPYPVAGNSTPNARSGGVLTILPPEPTGHETAKDVAGWLWRYGRYSPSGVGIAIWGFED